MYERIHPKRPARPPRAGQLAVAAVLSAVLMAGCGGSSGNSTATSGGAANAAAPNGSGSPSATPSTSTSAGSGATTGSDAGPANALAFAKCMRANGVSNFPDPQSDGGGFNFRAGPGLISSPKFKSAQAKCHALLPGLGDPGAGSFSPAETAQALAQLRSVAQCMRHHGISGFPDPTLTRPANVGLGQYSEITNYEGAWILFPTTIDMQSPAWQHAAAACGSLAESFNHPHH